LGINVQLIIPMSGLGSRFVKAGYQDLKPLIQVNGHPIIEWVLKMFPGVTRTIFVCRKDHLETTPLSSVLRSLAPEGEIVPIEGHKKGPVYAVSQAFEYINDSEPIIASYCDYYMHWDFASFCSQMSLNQSQGAIPCYTGFHPNLIPKKNLYASCRVDKSSNLLEIKEKFSFSKSKEQSLHSPGAYYFGSGSIMKKYFQIAMDEDLSLNGEYYISLVYNLLVRDSLKVSVPSCVPYFCQWGTPEDLREYQFWTKQVENFKHDTSHTHGRRREPV
jgi:NDP-sugar pyrophosphorylase family protein